MRSYLSKDNAFKRECGVFVADNTRLH